MPGAHSLWTLVPSHEKPAGHGLHAVRVVSVPPDVNEPGSHFLHAEALFSLHMLFMPQSTQSPPLPGRYVPARQGSCADAPRGQKLPLSQVTHAVDPLETWKLPAVHAVHSDWRVIAVNEPGTHGEWVVEPVAHEEPAGHAVQSGAAARPVLLEKVPARHGSSADAP